MLKNSPKCFQAMQRRTSGRGSCSILGCNAPTASFNGVVDTVSSIIVAIGKKAGVKVSERRGPKVKYATAHDLRRAFRHPLVRGS